MKFNYPVIANIIGYLTGGTPGIVEYVTQDQAVIRDEGPSSRSSHDNGPPLEISSILTYATA